MLIDNDGRVAGNVTSDFLLTFLIDKTSETSDVNILPCGHIIFNNGEKCFNGSRNICFIDSGFFCDLIDYVCLGHGEIFIYVAKNSSRQI